MVLALLAFCVMASPQVRAESEQLTQRTARQVQLAYEMQLNEKPNEAIDLLKGVSTTKKYDIAYIARMLGGLYWQIEQPKQAIKALTLAVEEKVLASEQHRDAQRMLADILLMEGEYQLAEYTYRELVPVYTRVSDLELVWLRIAQAQYQQQKWSLVETSINHQQRYLKEAKLQPKVTPLNMKLGAQIAQKKWHSALTTAKSLRELEPYNYLWWKQLTTLYIYTEQHNKALITLQQADRAGFELSEQLLILMAQLYAQNKVPQKAGETYARLKSLESRPELLAQQATYWQLAKEWSKASSSWRKAATLDQKYYWQHTLLMLKLNDFTAALASINQLSEITSDVLLAKTQALSALGHRSQALQVVTELHKVDPSDNSLHWIKYLTKD